MKNSEEEEAGELCAAEEEVLILPPLLVTLPDMVKPTEAVPTGDREAC